MKAYPNYKHAYRPIRDFIITIMISIGIAVIGFVAYCLFWAFCG